MTIWMNNIVLLMKEKYKSITLSIIYSFLLSILSVCFLYSIQMLSDIDIQSVPFGILAISAAIFVTIYAIIEYMYISNINEVEIDVRYKLRNQLHHRLMQVDYMTFSKQYYGEANTNIIYNVEQLGVLFFKQFPNSFTELLFLIVAFLSLIYINFYLAMMLLVFIIAFSCYIIFLKIKMEKYAKKYIEYRTKLNTSLDDYINQIRLLQLYGLEEDYANRVDCINKEMNCVWLKLNAFAPLIQSSIEIATLVSYLLVFGIGITLLELTIIDYAVVFLFLTYMPQIWTKYARVIEIYTYLTQGKAFAQQLYNDWDGDMVIAESEKIYEKHKVENQIIIKNVSFYYEKSHTILREFSYVFQTSGICLVKGPSGCGKSTMFDLLSGLLKPNNGEILLNGVKIDNIKNYTEILGVLHQETAIIEGSIIENIQWGNNKILAQEIQRFFEETGFSDSFTMDLTEHISHRDNRLTLGMKRIISLARIMLRNPKILLLDEITSGLDSHTEVVICEYIQKISVTIPCIIITHKSKDLFVADKVLMLGEDT